MALLFASCTLTPDEKYALLTFFFDDVPPPRSELHEELVEQEPIAVTRAPAPVEKLRWMLHGPYAKRDQCELCHAGDFTNRLVVETEELCWECHQREDLLWGRVVHPPVEANACLGCHDPHKSKNPNLLVSPPDAICEQCHDDETFPALGEHRAEQGADCLRCHDPHASDREYMLLGEAGP